MDSTKRQVGDSATRQRAMYPNQPVCGDSGATGMRKVEDGPFAMPTRVGRVKLGNGWDRRRQRYDGTSVVTLTHDDSQILVTAGRAAIMPP